MQKLEDMPGGDVLAEGLRQQQQAEEAAATAPEARPLAAKRSSLIYHPRQNEVERTVRAARASLASLAAALLPLQQTLDTLTAMPEEERTEAKERWDFDVVDAQELIRDALNLGGSYGLIDTAN